MIAVFALVAYLVLAPILPPVAILGFGVAVVCLAYRQAVR